MSNYKTLIQKLDQFIRKYYLNQVIRGSLYTVGIVLLLFLSFTLLEYEFYFSKGVRKGLFFAFLFISGLSVIYYIMTPLLHYFRLGKVISHKQAAQIIGEHFESVKDKLLNVLELKDQYEQNTNSDLLLASIEQKTQDIRLIPFKKAIDLRRNRKYLRYALPPLLVFIALMVAAPSIIKDGSNRIIRNNESFEKPAPFHFDILNEHLQAVQFEDFKLKVSVDGEMIPQDVYITFGEHDYKMKPVDKSTFEYVFKNIQHSTSFSMQSGDISSVPYTLDVLAKPQVVDVETILDYPNYTGRKDEKLKNAGDLIVPAGTKIKWIIQTRNTESVDFGLASEKGYEEAEQVGSNAYQSMRRIIQPDQYTLRISNSLLPVADSVSYALDVIPDRYPNISAEKFVDSTDQSIAYVSGTSSDDYGLSKITFNYEIKDAASNTIREKNTELLKTPGQTQATFNFLVEVDSFFLRPGEELSYYFEAWDNDMINGSKSSRTSMMTFRKPTLEEYKAQTAANNQDIKEELSKAIKESKELQEKTREMKEKLLNKKELGWEDKKELEKLMNKQKALQQQIQKAQNKFEENLQNESEYRQSSEEIKNKEEKLQEMFENSQNEEMQELMEKIQELMDEMDREQAMEMMDDAQMDQENMEMDMDRLLELFKQLEFEKEYTELANELNELADEQEELSEETGDQESTEDADEGAENEDELEEQGEEEGSEQSEEESSEESANQENESNQEANETGEKSPSEKQQDIQEEFEELMKELEELEKKNEELDQPKQLEDTEEMEENIQQDMQQSMQQMQQGQNKKASEKQKQASEKMKQMSDQMMAQMQSSQMQQMAEDLETLRQLLENLVRLSFDQEELVENFARTNAYVPRFTELVQVQGKIERDFEMVEDTLQALSKRNDQISGFITDKVRQIKRNIDRSLDNLEEREKSQASDHQRRTMKNLNDLALMLSESMEQMQQQMAGMMQGNMMCNNPKPGSGGKPMDVITQGQKKLNKEMMQKAKQRQGGKQQMGSKDFAEMAARQAALRKMLEEMQKGKSEQGKADPQLQQIIDEMNKIETDLVNKQLTNETMKRQQEILTRLLKAEKAERERDWDDKREAQTAQNKVRKLPPALEAYIKQREAEIDYFKTVSPDMKPLYKSLVERYYESLRQ